MQDVTRRIEKVAARSFAQGGFAELFKATLYFDDDTSTEVAIKFPIVHTFQGDGGKHDVQKIKKYWNRELTAGLSIVEHPNIIRTLGVCDNPEPAYKELVGIVLPFYPNGNAGVYLQQHPEVNKLRVLVLIAAALFAMHSCSPSVIHGDIKAANILIDENGEPVVADFGLSRVCEVSGFTTENISGSTRWMAAELLLASATSSNNGEVEPASVRITEASDVWAFAMTILEILTGKPPFAEYRNAAGVLIALVNNDVRPLRPSEPLISDPLWTLLEHCWAGNPTARPDMRHVGLALDIIYGLGHQMVAPATISKILMGAFDDRIQSTRNGEPDPALLPYRCKWLHCPRAFKSMPECVAHECDEFKQRYTAINRRRRCPAWTSTLGLVSRMFLV